MSISDLIPHDKALHGLGGVVLFATFRAVALVVGANRVEAKLAALAVVAIVACAKEAYDLQHRVKHTPDLLDAAATVAGGVLALACGLEPL